MSGPYIYTPHVSYQPTVYLAPYYDTQQPSPFIPEASLYHSPYSNPGSLPGTPRIVHGGLPSPGANSIHFPASSPTYAPPGWVVPDRERRPSWHAGLDGNTLQAPFRHVRSISSGAYGLPQPAGFGGYWPAPASPYSPGFNLQPNYLHIHPWLNGESPRNDFIFDLSNPSFTPSRYIGPGQTVLISQEEFTQQATHPPITRLRIVCDMIPQWPIDLTYNPQYLGGAYGIPGSPGGPAPPITFGDVLMAIHSTLHQRISQTDWAKLSPAEENVVSRSYTRRCKHAGSSEILLKNQGVKKVDFLLDKVWFRGLVRTADGFETMKLVVG